MKLSLSYSNITDANAELFLDHYDEMKGTFTTFAVQSDDAKGGWEGNNSAFASVMFE